MTFVERMQAISSLHDWLPDFMQSQNHEKMACSKPRQVNMPLLNSLKRKRTGSDTFSSSSDIVQLKRQKQAAIAQSQKTSAPTKGTVATRVEPEITPIQQPQQTNDSVAVPDSQQDHTPPVARDAQLQVKARQQIEAHFNLEILYKHNELRLIEQEMAKCQVALEQLRRCRAIPYPGQPGSTFTPEHIGTGTGPALEPPPGFSQPQDPAPWGVTDGPYSRHYARWLIPDPRFDAVPVQQPRAVVPPVAGKIPTRGARTSIPSDDPSRAPRRSTASKLSAMSPYGLPKDKVGPLIEKRKSDGLMVRVICKFCQKDLFHTVQGFINHCRIEHKFSYPSHSAALDECGVPVSEDELASLTAASAEQRSSSSNVGASTGSTYVAPLVHPLIMQNRQNPSGDSTSVTTPSSSSSAQQAVDRLAMPPPKLPNTNNPNNVFTPSDSEPRLSGLLKKLGSTGNLSSLVDHVKDRSDFNNIMEQLQSDEEDQPPKPARPKAGRGRGGRRNTVHSASNSQSTTPAPLKLNLSTQRLGSSMSEASPGLLTASTMTPGMMTATTDFAASPMTAITETTMSPGAMSAASPYSARSFNNNRQPRSDINAFTSTFGQVNGAPNGSFNPNHPAAHPLARTQTSTQTMTRGAHRRTQSQAVAPVTPLDGHTPEPMDLSPANTAPGLMTDTEDVRSPQDEESDRDTEHEGRTVNGVRIRTSMDSTNSVAEDVQYEKK